ncbi:MAG: NAD(P)H-hydrate dehydratase [Myxococcota bacterium]|nr:NAD(P)H-hydrate dehydratase [Myxococcota bacterium]
MRHLISTPGQVRAMDAHTIEALGVSSMALMELAGRAVATEVVRWVGQRGLQEVCVFAGRGNNGGDGYVVARHLHLAGIPVRVFGMGGEHSSDCARNRSSAEKLGIAITEDVSDVPEGGLVVDALLGTGLKEALRGGVLERVAVINGLGCPVISVDMPTGICGETGRVLGDAVRADATVAIGRAKVGAFGAPGSDYVGELVVADIGLVDSDARHVACVVDGAWVAERLPGRSPSAHKGQQGHLGVVAGSADKAGAAVLLCNAAMRSGCGLVTLLIDPGARGRLSNLRDEVMVEASGAPTPEELERFDAVAVGPGFGVDAESLELLRTLWHEVSVPGVFDADGLTALAGAPMASRFQRCMTPHPGEAARLLGIETSAVQANRFQACQSLGALSPALLKGRNTLVFGDEMYINRTGTAALATAGSGDVLTGIVGALLAQGLGTVDALVCGAFVHGLAGERAGEAPIVAGDVVEALPESFRTVSMRTEMMGFQPLLG